MKATVGFKLRAQAADLRGVSHAARRALGAWLLVVALLTAGAASACATTYYVAADGSDANPGTSADQPFATLDAVYALDLQPGDEVLFRGGDTFVGCLCFGPEDSGAAGDPVVAGSYGTGRATIAARVGDDAVWSYDQSHVVLQDLRIAGHGPLTTDRNGIDFYNDTGTELTDVTFRRMEISGFHQWGISVDSYLDGSSYRGVTMTDLDVHDNGLGAITTWTDPTDSSAVWPNVPANHDVEVSHSVIHDNRGWSGNAPSPTGNGVILSHVDGGRMHDDVAYDNGGLDDNPNYGPCAMYAYESAHIRIDHNEAYDNHTGSPHDGCAFDLDDKVTDSVMEDNYSHGNDGAGFMWCNLSQTPYTGNVIRDNISVDDGLAGHQAGIFVYERAAGTRIEHNTVVTPTATAVNRPVALALVGLPAAGSGDPALIRDNLLVARGPAGLVLSTSGEPAGGPDAVLQGNDWFSTAGTPQFRVGYLGQTLGGLAAFRGATGQETLGGAPVGLDADPLLAGPLGDPGVAAYVPEAGSPVRDAGVDTAPGLGPVDFSGGPRVVGAGEDVGAFELPAEPATPATAVGPTPPSAEPAGSSPAAAPIATAAPASAPASPSSRRVSLQVASRIRVDVRRPRLRVRVTCRDAAPCTARLTVTVRRRVADASLRDVRVATGVARLERPGSRWLTLRLSRTVVRALLARGRMVVTVRLSGAPPARVALTAAPARPSRRHR